MKTKLKYTLLPALAAGLFVVTGCATNRPPRQVGGPGLQPMPPSFEEVYHGGGRPESVQPMPIEVMPLPGTPIQVAPAPTPVPAPIAPRTGTPYTIRRGDSLSGIAARHRITWRELADYNHIADPNRIRVGQTILLPPDAVGTAAAPQTGAPAPVAPAPAPAMAGSGTYVVQPGDNLTVVARRNNTTIRALREVNNLSSDTIRVGQTLKLPAGGTSTSMADTGRSVPAPSPVATPRPVTPPSTGGVTPPVAPVVPAPAPEVEPPADERAFTIVVEEGDTLESISTSYVVSIEALRRENNLGPNAQVKAGDRLRIPPTSW